MKKQTLRLWHLFFALYAFVGSSSLSSAAPCSVSVYENLPENLTRLCVAMQAAFEKGLTQAGVDGWESRRDTHASYEFRVDKAATRWQGKADDQISTNRRRANHYFGNTDAIRIFLAEIVDQGRPAQKPDPTKLSFLAIRRLSQIIAEGISSNSAFETQDTLGTVGWESGDRESPSGDVPLGPIGAASHIMSRSENGVWKLLTAKTHNDKELSEIQEFLIDAIARTSEERKSLEDLMVPSQFKCKDILKNVNPGMEPRVPGNEFEI